MKISHLLKYIADLNPQNTPARLAFYNFLRHFQFAVEDLTPSVLNAFFSHALEYPHWETNKSNLGKEVQLLMESFVRFSKMDFEFTKVHFPQTIQLVEIQSFSDLLEITHTYARSTLFEEDKFRLIPDQGRKVVLVVLKSDQSVDISVFDKKFVIRGGRLEPLRTDLKLSYNSNLELKEGVVHCLEVAPYLLAQFTMVEGCPQGCLLRGYVCHQDQELSGLILEEQTKVLFPLKKLEQLFIDKQSDPFYLNLMEQMNNAPTHLKGGDLASEKIARRALEKAELALKEIFMGDKMLSELIKDLQQLLQQRISKDPMVWEKQQSQGLIS
jgi:hypothetical protein